jgi:hypothetical protein
MRQEQHIEWLSRIWTILSLFGMALIFWIVCWWPIYGLIWLLAGWKYVILTIEIKAAIIIFVMSVFAIYQFWKIFLRKPKLIVYIVTFPDR